MIKTALRQSYLRHTPAVPTALSKSLEYANITHFTDIQDQAVSRGILEGKNMLLHSESGSGKTLAYLLPILENLYEGGLKDRRYLMH